ncbi:MAG: HipA N-terminal domain-containing protein [Myxococcales bacterium]|nr:HipA N-terminal domain-containing protein [Myxococcales bacterium]MCB9547341.1 HipA N-terminal domain-containing protein [Myxococcales bacterium]
MKESLRSVLESWGLVAVRAKGASAGDRPKPGLTLSIRQPDGSILEVGELTQEGTDFLFRYVPSFVASGARPIRTFPSFNAEYRSDVLWPFFAVRLPSLKRPEIREIIEREGIDPDDVITLLCRLGKRTASNPFELHPMSKRQRASALALAEES